MSDNYESQWHLDKRLNVGHLLMTFSIAAGAFWWAMGVDKRVQSNEDAIIHHKEMVTSKQGDINKSIRRLDRKIDKMDEKIDRVLINMNNTRMGSGGAP